jgi:rod shape-determining protein MreD
MRRELVAAVIALVISLPLKLFEFVFLPSIARPDLLMVLSISAGYTAGWNYGIYAGFLIGLLEDVFVGRVLGVRALSLAVAALISASTRDYVTPDAILPRALLSGGSALIGDSAAYVLLSAKGRSVTFRHFVSHILKYGIIWSIVLALPVSYFLYAASKKFEETFPERNPKGRFLT